MTIFSHSSYNTDRLFLVSLSKLNIFAQRLGFPSAQLFYPDEHEVTGAICVNIYSLFGR